MSHLGESFLGQRREHTRQIRCYVLSMQDAKVKVSYKPISASLSVVTQRCHTHKQRPPSQGVIQANISHHISCHTKVLCPINARCKSQGVIQANISLPLSCHTKVSYTQAKASKSRCHTSQYQPPYQLSYKGVTRTLSAGAFL